MKIPVSLPSGLSASGSAFSCDRILATDGFDCSVYDVDRKCCIPTKRPYRFITALCAACSLIALGEGCSNRVYLLDGDLTETEAFTPDADGDVLQSVYPCPCGGSLLFTYRNGVYTGDLCGGITSKIKSAHNGNDFISVFPANGYMLTAYNNGYADVIEYSGCDGSTRCVLPECVRIKSFAALENNTVYGLFSKGYPYSFLAPVTENGVFTCPCI